MELDKSMPAGRQIQHLDLSGEEPIHASKLELDKPIQVPVHNRSKHSNPPTFLNKENRMSQRNNFNQRSRVESNTHPDIHSQPSYNMQIPKACSTPMESTYRGKGSVHPLIGRPNKHLLNAIHEEPFSSSQLAASQSSLGLPERGIMPLLSPPNAASTAIEMSDLSVFPSETKTIQAIRKHNNMSNKRQFSFFNLFQDGHKLKGDCATMDKKQTYRISELETDLHLTEAVPVKQSGNSLWSSFELDSRPSKAKKQNTYQPEPTIGVKQNIDETSSLDRAINQKIMGTLRPPLLSTPMQTRHESPPNGKLPDVEAFSQCHYNSFEKRNIEPDYSTGVDVHKRLSALLDDSDEVCSFK